MTALEKLINWIENSENSVASMSFTELDFKTLSQFKDKFKSLLEEEKQNIILAYELGFHEGVESDYYNNSIDVYKQGLAYFNQTFKENEN